MNPRKKFAVGLASIAVPLLSLAGVSNASHLQPKKAPLFRTFLVPAAKQCGAPNTTHPPGIPGCNPPANTSTFLQVGTPSVNSAAPKSVGELVVSVVTSPVDDALVSFQIIDVRCKTIVPGFCSTANFAGTPPDYGNNGQVEVKYTVRITGHSFGSSGSDPGTTIDFPFSFAATCVATAALNIGGTCSVSTNYSAILPGIVPTGKADIWEYGQIQVYDGGSDGTAATEADNTLFEVQGNYFP